MNPFLAIISCEHDQKRGCHDAIRETYLRAVDHQFPHMFFLGAGVTPQGPDEMQTDAGDGYNHTYQKNNAIVRCFLASGYTHLITGDVDTYFVLPRLLAAGLDEHDYVGRRCDEGHAGGGYGYVLSRRAAEVLWAHPPKGTEAYNDLGIGMKLQEYGVHLWARNDLFLPAVPFSWAGDAVAAHLGRGTGTWNPQWMRDCHTQFLEQVK